MYSYRELNTSVRAQFSGIQDRGTNVIGQNPFEAKALLNNI